MKASALAPVGHVSHVMAALACVQSKSDKQATPHINLLSFFMSIIWLFCCFWFLGLIDLSQWVASSPPQQLGCRPCIATYVLLEC